MGDVYNFSKYLIYVLTASIYQIGHAAAQVCHVSIIQGGRWRRVIGPRQTCLVRLHQPHNPNRTKMSHISNISNLCDIKTDFSGLSASPKNKISDIFCVLLTQTKVYSSDLRDWVCHPIIQYFIYSFFYRRILYIKHYVIGWGLPSQD